MGHLREAIVLCPLNFSLASASVELRQLRKYLGCKQRLRNAVNESNLQLNPTRSFCGELPIHEDGEPARGFDGLIASSYTSGLVALNSVTGCDIGITPSGSGLKLQSNETSGNCIGLFVDDPAALVRWNTANDNCTEGIVIGQAGASLKKNTADNNADIGIDAVLGTIDLGGNTATGNATDCLGVVCLPLP